MKSLIASYETPLGARLELHYAGKFWTERRDGEGTSLVAVDALRAHEHYELARAHGSVFNSFPMKLRGVAA